MILLIKAILYDGQEHACESRLQRLRLGIEFARSAGHQLSNPEVFFDALFENNFAQRFVYDILFPLPGTPADFRLRTVPRPPLNDPEVDVASLKAALGPE